MKYQRDYSTVARMPHRLGTFLTIFIFTVMISAGYAWSFEQTPTQISAQDSALHETLSYQSSSPVAVDPCLPLLKSIHYTSPSSTVSRNRRSAGKAAALGLVFGVRFALSPSTKSRSSLRSKSKEAPEMRFDVWRPKAVKPYDRSAQSISAYRSCQKKEALQALRDFRWIR